MEALVILLAELLGAPIIAALVFFATLGLLIVTLLLGLPPRLLARGSDGGEFLSRPLQIAAQAFAHPRLDAGERFRHSHSHGG